MRALITTMAERLRPRGRARRQTYRPVTDAVLARAAR